MAPSGKYLMADLYDIGGIPSVQKLLIAAGMIDGSTITITGKTLAENVESWPSLKQGQEIIRSLDNPIKATGHLEILYGNLAPNGAVAKITGKEGMIFTGKAKVFNKEHELDDALNKGEIPRTENLVLVVRYEGPKGGPGMPEQLKASASIMGAGLKNIALITDGRYSGASHGLIIKVELSFSKVIHSEYLAIWFLKFHRNSLYCSWLRMFQNPVRSTMTQTTIVSDQTWTVCVTVSASEAMTITQW